MNIAYRGWNPDAKSDTERNCMEPAYINVLESNTMNTEYPLLSIKIPYAAPSTR